MTKQYWVDNYYIDSSRNQIIQNNTSQTLPPKALAVLTYLAEHQGQVVSHDTLLDNVWPNTVVSPNTLQRSIAQLRKVFGDDGKVQSYIKTHTKKGYSLECEIRWIKDDTTTQIIDHQESNEKHKDTVINETNKRSDQAQSLSMYLISIPIILLIIATSVIVYQSLTAQKSSPLSFDTMQLLTATDDKEFDASYTPDGQHIVFHRYLGKLCVNKIWAKNIHTQKETPLTKDWGAYGRHSFSKDGKQLVFLATEACNQPVAQKNCYDLVNVDFQKALETPQKPHVMLQCQNSTVDKPIWLNNNNITLLQRNSDLWKIIKYSINNNSSTDLFVPKQGNVIDYAYSASEDLIAVIGINNNNQYFITMLKPDGDILSSHQIKYPKEIAKFRPIYPSFDPKNKQLVFSTGRQLFTLSYDGKITKINSPFADKVQQPEFHPDGSKLLMIKGPYDSDIVLQPLQHNADANSIIQQEQSQLTTQYSIFERTTLGEDHASFQPNGELIAFWSERSGEHQLWVSDGNNTRQLSHFPMDSYISGFDWAADGQSLLIAANGELIQMELDSQQQSFPLKLPVIKLFQWNSDENSALLLVRMNGIIKLVEYDLNDFSYSILTDKVVLWARKSEEGQLIYKDRLDQFWQPGPAEDQHIKALDKHGTKSKSFVLNDQIIYAINSDNQLWSYDLNNGAFNILGKVNKDVDYLTDVNQSHALMTIQVAAKKEVVELSTSQ